MRELITAGILAALLATGAWAQAVNHTGTANCVDDRDGDISALVSWSSDMQGALGVGSPVQFDLNEGTHIVTAVCADVAGNQATASQSVTVILEDTTPPSLSITVEPTQHAGIMVTPTDPINGNYSMELTRNTDGRAAYVDKIEGVVSESGHVVADWGGRIEARVTIRHREAVLADGFEMVVMRGADAQEAPIWDLVLVGTAAEPLAFARAHTTPLTAETVPMVLTEDTNQFIVTWQRGAGDGLVRLLVGFDSQEVLGLDLDREMIHLMLGGPVTTDGLGGRLLFDDVEVFQL